MQCFQVSRLFIADFHDPNIILLCLIGKHLGKNFIFHCNNGISNDIFSKFSSFYQNIFIKCISSNNEKPTLPPVILSEFIWFNSKIKVDSKPVHFPLFDKTLNFVGQLFSNNGNLQPWEDIKIEFYLKDTQEIYLLLISDALPKSWKDIILKDKRNAKNFVNFDRGIVRKSQICSLNKLTRN